MVFDVINNSMEKDGISRIQAIFRGGRSRNLHIKRARAGCKIICPFYACSVSVVKSMLDLCHITSSDLVFDLGSGNGNILLNIASSTHAKCIGFDIDSSLCETATRRARESGVAHLVDFVVEDIYFVDLASASVICMFLVPSCLKVLSPRLWERFQRGVRIVCYKFPLPVDDGWLPSAVVETEDVINTIDSTSRSNVYFYCVWRCFLFCIIWH